MLHPFDVPAGSMPKSKMGKFLYVNYLYIQVAEGVGFEPTKRSPVYTLSKRAPSATRPPLRRSAEKVPKRPTGIKGQLGFF